MTVYHLMPIAGRYMQEWYQDRGLENSGLPRPHYEIPEGLLYRAASGEVLLHPSHADTSHGCQPIHAEPNPCPDRHLFVFDWKNIIRQDENGTFLPCSEIPEDAILRHMRALEDCSASAYRRRLEDVAEVAATLLDKGGCYPGGRGAIETVLAQLESVLCSPQPV
jgi:hypothetical protein